jgi:hypothetical protein
VRIFAGQDGRYRETIGNHCRHVLAAVHRDVDLPFQERVLDFFDEQTLAADFGERRLLQPIARRLDHDNAARRTARVLNALRDRVRLPQRQLAAARPQPKL